jgi:DNA invertase Pin-like site-specific DNA recombinase
MTTKRAFGYVRLSKMDEGTTSPQRQRQVISRWCKDHSAELVEVFEDLDLSAYAKGVRRPGLERMLSRLDEVDTIVTWKLDRLARSVSGFSKLMEIFDDAKVKFVTTDGAVDMTTANGRALVGVTAVFAELEASTTSERARQMHAYKREHGEWVGRVPYGFKRNGKSIEVDPDEFDRLTEAARRYIGGESLRTIAADVGMHHPNLAARLRSDRVLEALPPEVAGPLATAMAERGRTGTRAKRSLLGGIARCEICDGPMTVVATRMRNPEQRWSAYACKERKHVYISRPWLDAYVTDQVIAAIDTGEIVKRLKRRRKRSPALASKEIEARLELLEVDFYEKGIIPRDRYLQRREGLLRRLQRARSAEVDVGIDLPVELAKHLGERFETFTLANQRRIFAAVVEKIVVQRATSHGPVDPGRVDVVWRT